MALLVACLALLVGSGIAALPLRRAPGAALALGACGAIAGAFGLAWVALGSLAAGFAPLALDRPLSLPAGSFALRLDGLAAFFLLLIAVLTIPAAAFGAGYLRRHAAGKHAGLAACLLNVLIASMALVVTAANAILFVIAWEVMTITSYLLVVFDHEREEVRAAGARYLIASQLAGACLLAMFAVLGAGPSHSEFAAFRGVLETSTAGTTAIVLVLALLGFGTKMGLAPMHVWLPEAHPAAPSHVSALMSGVMIKMGVYGLLRTLSWCPRVPDWFAATLLGVGAITAVLGILFAIGQRNLKRALAWSSIENMGVVAVGIGLAALAAGHGHTTLASLALHGTLLHCLMHMLCKGLLFLCAGAVQGATHTGDVEALGGLLARMRITATAFLAGAVGVCALPPMASFAGEGAILAAGFGCAMRLPSWAAILAAFAILALVLAGGLAVASFTRLAGLVCLGQPRSRASAEAREPGAAIVTPIVALALLVLALAALPLLAIRVPHAAAETVLRAWLPAAAVASVPALLQQLAVGAALFAASLLIGALLRHALLRATARARAATWGCGFARPSERMQYTGTSYGQPIVDTFDAVLAPERTRVRAEGFFARTVAHATRVPDRIERGLFVPLFTAIGRRLSAVRRFQDGNLQKYLLQIVLGLGVGLAWVVVSLLLVKR